MNWGLVYDGGADSSDFVLPSATTLTFASGSTDDQTFEVRVRKDQLAELNEGFHVALSGATLGSSVGSAGRSAGTITNDDLGLQLAAGFATTISHPEGQSGTTEFTWTIIKPPKNTPPNSSAGLIGAKDPAAAIAAE